mmetsp:Transcript_41060/g.133086  ORF Transcript_41060/g.133086 Transcript_41060/m.133086 type:complete len:378 (+) Transcript_41060:197-1330(+)
MGDRELARRSKRLGGGERLLELASVGLRAGVEVVPGEAARLGAVVGAAPARRPKRGARGDRVYARVVVLLEVEARPALRERIVPPQVVLAVDPHGARQRRDLEGLPRRVLRQQLRHKVGQRGLVERRHARAPRRRHGARVVVVLAQPLDGGGHIGRRVDRMVVHARQQAVLVKLLVPHPLADVQHDRAAEEQRLELVGVADRRRVEQVLVAALVLEAHEALVLLVAARRVQLHLLARLPDLAVIADEELVHKHLARRLLGHRRQALAVHGAHVARVHRNLELVLPAHLAARLDQLRVEHGPRRRAQLVRLARKVPGKVEPRQVHDTAAGGGGEDGRRERPAPRSWPAAARLGPRGSHTGEGGHSRLVVPRDNDVDVW